MRPALFPSRVPFEPALGCLEEARRFDRYLRSRNRYKRELMDSLLASIGQGPVLEAGHGFGGFGLELLARKRFPLYSFGAGDHARRFLEDEARERGLEARCLPWTAEKGRELPAGFFELVYSVNSLHEWEAPAAVLLDLHALTRPGGALVVNDLRRDADPFITEYVLREMEEEGSEEGSYGARAFARSLRAAYSAGELREILEISGLGYELEDAEAMTLTVWIRKEA